MAEALLTIAIPTYNRSVDLDRLLGSIAVALNGVAPGAVNILVSDNASSDQTADVAKRHQVALPTLTYRRNPVNIGMQLNFWRCIQQCDSTYIWMIGDDESIEENGIVDVIDSISRLQCPVYVFNYTSEWNFPAHALRTVYGKPIETGRTNVSSFVKRHGWLWTFGNLGMVVVRTADLKRLNPGAHTKHSFMQAALYLEAFHEQDMMFIDRAVFRTFVRSQTTNKERWETDGTTASWGQLVDSLDLMIENKTVAPLQPVSFFNHCSSDSYPTWMYFVDRIKAKIMSGNIGIPDEEWSVVTRFMERVEDVSQRNRLLVSLDTIRKSAQIAKASFEMCHNLFAVHDYAFKGGFIP